MSLLIGLKWQRREVVGIVAEDNPVVTGNVAVRFWVVMRDVGVASLILKSSLNTASGNPLIETIWLLSMIVPNEFGYGHWGGVKLEV